MTNYSQDNVFVSVLSKQNKQLSSFQVEECLSNMIQHIHDDAEQRTPHPLLTDDP